VKIEIGRVKSWEPFPISLFTLHSFPCKAGRGRSEAEGEGQRRWDIVRLIDFTDVRATDWFVVNQFTVIEGQHNRRPDIVVFVNGLPLGLIEL
jgi:hypothetical protein